MVPKSFLACLLVLPLLLDHPVSAGMLNRMIRGKKTSDREPLLNKAIDDFGESPSPSFREGKSDFNTCIRFMLDQNSRQSDFSEIA
jgi:hypothetical protein